MRGEQDWEGGPTQVCVEASTFEKCHPVLSQARALAAQPGSVPEACPALPWTERALGRRAEQVGTGRLTLRHCTKVQPEGGTWVLPSAPHRIAHTPSSSLPPNTLGDFLAPGFLFLFTLCHTLSGEQFLGSVFSPHGVCMCGRDKGPLLPSPGLSGHSQGRVRSESLLPITGEKPAGGGALWAMPGSAPTRPLKTPRYITPWEGEAEGPGEALCGPP